MNIDNPLNELLPCDAAAREMEEHLGVMAHGPFVGELLRHFQSCRAPGCLGIPRSMVIDETMTRLEADMILALRN